MVGSYANTESSVQCSLVERSLKVYFNYLFFYKRPLPVFFHIRHNIPVELIRKAPSDGGGARGVRLSTWKQDINVEEIIL